MATWNGGKPNDINELFEFYHDYVKPLYSSVQTQNELPTETLFEINAALDHLSVHWVYGVDEAKVAAEAFSHLKRSCLDIFKLKVREARDQYDRLCKINIGLIDNGEYEKNLHALFNKIRQKSQQARKAESGISSDGTIPSFPLWEDVYADCVKLEQEFFLHKSLNWAQKKGLMITIKNHTVGFILGVFASIVASVLYGNFPALQLAFSSILTSLTLK